VNVVDIYLILCWYSPVYEFSLSLSLRYIIGCDKGSGMEDVLLKYLLAEIKRLKEEVNRLRKLERADREAKYDKENDYWSI